jgi:hypothetical protein
MDYGWITNNEQMDDWRILFQMDRLEICSFSGHKIYPAKGKTYVRVDSR